MPRKFIDGATEYVKHWPGPVRVLARRSVDVGDNLDEAPIDSESLPFELLLRDEENGDDLAGCVSNAAVVLATLVEPYLPLARRCRSAGVPLVFVAENSVRTRRQQIAAIAPNIAVRWRRQWYTTRMESRYRDALRLASGVQCNGTPTYDAYRDLTPNPLLYFDTRATPSMIVSHSLLESRLNELMGGKLLRLAWSGRFVAIKGVDHLVMVAAELRRLGVAFTLDLCGDGPTRSALQQAVDRHGLREHVRFRGVLDFSRELMPFIARDIDLFVCCHRQGDPSCTYMETLSCGVPIIGYDNDAWAGLQRASGSGWVTPMDQTRAMARGIARLDRDRGTIADAARAARQFAADRTFDRVMQSRVEHLLRCRQLEGVPAPPVNSHVGPSVRLGAGASS